LGQVIDACKAASAALRFWALNLPTLLRLSWLPLALLSVVGFGWHYWSGEAAIAVANGGAALIELPYTGSDEGIVLWVILQLVALSAAAVAVHRAVLLGERREGQYFHFGFGLSEAAYFAMGVIAYVLMVALVAGQYLAQLTMPDVTPALLGTVVKPYAELGLVSLSMFAFPGELAIFGMPPLNYALWCALVIATFVVLVRLSAWPAVVAAEGSLALPTALSLTRKRVGAIIAFFATVAAFAGVVLLLLSLAGLSSLAFAGADGLGGFLASLTNAGADATQSVEVQGILNERRLALFQEIARFLSGIFGVTVGATLTSHLALYLHGSRGTQAPA
jgi:hypothetical protein